MPTQTSTFDESAHPRGGDGKFATKTLSDPGTSADLSMPRAVPDGALVRDLRGHFDVACEMQDVDRQSEIGEQAAEMIRSMPDPSLEALDAVRRYEWWETREEATEATEDMLNYLDQATRRD